MEVKEVINEQNLEMHKSFGKTYDITETNRLYHGSDHAEQIAKDGIRSAMSMRSRWGKGICTTSDPYQALSYSQGDGNGNDLKLVIADVLIGPHTVGWQDREDFGENSEGEPNLTLTDPSGTIFVSKYDFQINVRAIITMRFMSEKKHTKMNQEIVRYYNKSLLQYVQNPNPLLRVSVGSVSSVGSIGNVGSTMTKFAIPSRVGGSAITAFAKSSSVFAKPNSVFAKPSSVFAKPNSVFAKPNSAFATPSSAFATPSRVGSSGGVSGASDSGSGSGISRTSMVSQEGSSALSVGGDNHTRAVYIPDPKEYVNYNHQFHSVGQKVIVTDSINNNKQNIPKFGKFVGYMGIIEKIMARDSRKVIFFVRLMENDKGEPVPPTIKKELEELNGNSCKFLKGQDRNFLTNLLCKESYIMSVTAKIAQDKYDKNMQDWHNKKKRTRDALLMTLADAAAAVSAIDVVASDTSADTSADTDATAHPSTKKARSAEDNNP